MKMTDLRAKARAIFGSAIAEPMPNQPNGAKALQQRANARPIPTYKVGGVVKKQNGGAMPPRTSGGSPEADDVLITTPRGRQIDAEMRRRERERAAAKAKAEAEKRARMDRVLGIPAQKSGGKAGMKKGGKPKDGLAVMIAIGKAKPVKEKATGEMYSSKKAMAKHEAAESAGMERMERMKKSRKSMMDGGDIPIDMQASKLNPQPSKMAVGGAGKTRKGQAPIKKAQGGKASDRGVPVALQKKAGVVPTPVMPTPEMPSPTPIVYNAPVKKAQGGAGKVRKGMMKG
jgi:hypothetical protein